MRLNSENGFGMRMGLICIGMITSLVLIIADQSNARTRAIPLSTSVPEYSNDTSRRLQNSVLRLNAWLSGSKESSGWRRALLLNVLDTQSARAEQADIGTLQEIHSRFAANTDGLDHPAFRDVRIALEQQIKHLSVSRIGDLHMAVLMARGKYRPISVATVMHQRDYAKYELQLLKKYYHHTMSNRNRANLFNDIKLDEAIEFLDAVQFELPPEISVGKLDSMIEGVEEKLEAVIEAIDAMPFTPEPDEPEVNAPEEDGQDIEPPESSSDNVPPQPDEEKPTIEDLRKDQKKLEAQIEELKEQRSAIKESDRPRQKLWSETFNQLRAYEANFLKASKDQGDPYFVSAATTFERFVRTYYFGSLDNLQEDFLKRLENLKDELLKLDGSEARDAAGQVGDHLRWIENANQVPELVTAIRARYSNPNLYLSVSARLLSQIANRSISNGRYLRENIDGRLVRGRVYTNANVTLDLQNDPNQVHASIHLLGDMKSSTFVEQRNVRAMRRWMDNWRLAEVSTPTWVGCLHPTPRSQRMSTRCSVERILHLGSSTESPPKNLKRCE